ncbi:MAG: VanZ family protein [Burkholderiales bacterium]
MPQSNASHLARYLLAAYTVLVVYASLHPLHGWHDRGASLFAFLEPVMPRYATAFDTIINIAAYVPFGFLVMAALHPMRWAAVGVAIALAASVALSGAMEALQTLLPNRVSSNLDFVLNVAGGFTGALAGAWFAPRLIDNETARRLRVTWFRPGARTDLGLVIVALWLLTQLNPETLLFGTGSLRGVLETVPGTLHPVGVFVGVEAVVAAAHLVAAGLFVGMLVRPRRSFWVIITLVIAAAIVLRAFAFATLFSPENMFRWATSGALQGLVAGLMMLLLVARFRRTIRVVIACLFFMFATALVNVVPGNPYTANALQVWRQGHFLNFNGLTGFVSTLWPFLALAYLLFAVIPVGQRRREMAED